MIALAAEPIATALGSSEAGPVLRVLSLTLVLASAGVVPSAMLARRFDQKRLFLIAGADLTVNATVTISLVVAGWGPMALALGRVCGQSTTLVLQFVLSGEGAEPEVTNAEKTQKTSTSTVKRPTV
ncbi:oligosaccharide flippase family protein [Georgenia sp. SUBG003]|uniref:oligosaccharide flippase family protein n=1 Tax=Georgenia sp. SUBG003 TaxID=1497974 RepID=UPI003AB79FD6